MPVVVEPAAGHANVKSLFGAWGYYGITPPGLEPWSAVAVVEINSPSETTHVAVSDFVLFDKTGKITKVKRVLAVEEFNRPRVATEGEAAYYLNPGGTRPWNGTLPVGRIRLRIRVELNESPVAFPLWFRFTIGQYVIEGPVECMWPS